MNANCSIKTFFCCIALFLGLEIQAQSSLGYTLVTTDSVAVTDDARFIYQNIAVKNTTAQPLGLSLTYTIPKGWRCLSEIQELTLAPWEQKQFTLTLLAQPGALASWQQFLINTTSKHTGFKGEHSFYLKAKTIHLYGASMHTPEIKLTNGIKSFDLKIFLQNAGNTSSKFQIHYQAGLLDLNRKQTITLPPATDTVVVQTIRVPDEKFKFLLKDEIYVRITDSITSRLMTATVVKMNSEMKANQSAYAVIPTDIETGYMQLEKVSSYFASVRAKADLGKGKNLGVSYRTKDFGQQNQLQRNILDLRYTTDVLNLLVGQIRTNRFFISDGTGFNVDYNVSKKVKVGGAMALHTKNSFFNNNTYTAFVAYDWKQFKVEHVLAASTEKALREANHIWLNSIKYKIGSKWDLSITAGLGREKYLGKSVKETGIAYGYKAIYEQKALHFHSEVVNHNQYFPGFNRGLKISNHMLRRNSKSWGMGIFYQSNQTLSSYLRDTIYNTNGLSLNLIKYGFLTSFAKKKASYTLEGGKFIQRGMESNQLASYAYSNAGIIYKPGTDFQFQLSSLSGFGKLNGKASANNPTIWIHNINNTIQYKFLGINSFYVSVPVIEKDSLTKRLMGHDRTMNVSPFVGFTLLKVISTNFSYTLSKSLLDSNTTHFTGGRLNYTNLRTGLSVNLVANIPLSASNAMGRGLREPFYSFSLRKRIDIPVIWKRKFHTLKVIAFDDRDGNGVKEKHETALKNIQINVNNIPFVSNSSGTITYKNVQEGTFNLDLNHVTGLKGLVPANGNLQEVKLPPSRDVMIPFKRSKVISGTIQVHLDSISHTIFNPAGLKVIATDSTGQYYSTLANSDGVFYLNVPSGVYNVSLNPRAFDEKMRPVVLSFTIDITNKEEEVVNFLIQERKRQIRMLNK